MTSTKVTRFIIMVGGLLLSWFCFVATVKQMPFQLELTRPALIVLCVVGVLAYYWLLYTSIKHDNLWGIIPSVALFGLLQLAMYALDTSGHGWAGLACGGLLLGLPSIVIIGVNLKYIK